MSKKSRIFHYQYILASLIIVGFLQSCGGGGGSSSNGNNNKTLNTGTFTDIEINNLQYSTDGEILKTTKDNKFYYSDDSAVKFYIDGIFIGETIPKKEISFFDDVVQSEDHMFSDKNINALTLLKTFDNDNNIDNGVKIQENTQGGNSDSYSHSANSASINNNQNIKNTIKIDDYHSIFISNLSNEYKNKQIYNTDFNFKPQCKSLHTYVFDERVTNYLCSHYDRIPWIQKYQNYLRFMQTQLIESEQESWDQNQAKIAQIMKTLATYQDLVKAGLTREKLTSLNKLAEGITKLMIINKDMKDLTVGEVDKVFAATENILLALNGGLDAEKVIKILENYSNFNDMEKAETFLKSVNGYLNDFDGLNSLAIVSGISIAKTGALEFIKNTELNKKTGGIFANTANMMFDAVNAHQGCLKKLQPDSIIQCLGDSGYDLFEGLIFNLAHIVSSLTHYYAWNENRDLSNHFLKQRLALEYFLKRNFDETVIRLDISSNLNNPINWMSKPMYFLFGMQNKDNTQFWFSLENELEKLNNGDSLTLDEIDKNAIMGLFNPDAVIKVAKGILRLIQNEEENKIIIHYVDIVANPFSSTMSKHQIKCDLNGETILNDNFEPTYNNTGYSKEVSYTSAPRTQTLLCNISTDDFHNDTKLLEFDYNIVEKPSQPVTNSPGSSNHPGAIVTNKRPVLEWSKVNNATYYDVTVRNVETDELVVNETDVVTTYWQVVSDLPVGKYFWNVSACNDAGCSIWSDPLYFQIEEVQGVSIKPSGLTPGGDSSIPKELSSSNITLRWSATDNASKYKLEIFDLNTQRYILEDEDVLGTSYDASSLLDYGHRYFWGLYACNSNNECSGRTRVYFNIVGEVITPEQPSGLTPGSTFSSNPEEVGGTTQTLKWNVVDNASWYRINVVKARVNRSGPTVLSKNVFENSYAISNLEVGKNYWWYVQACNDDACSDANNGVGFFIEEGTQICTPNATQNSSCAIYRGNGSQSRTCSSDGQSWSSYSGCFVTSCDSGYHQSGNSCVKDSVTISIPQNFNVVNSGRSATFSWSFSTGVDSYEIDLEDRTTGNDNRTISTTNIYHVATDLKYGRSYKAKVRANDNGNYSDYSNYKLFSTALCPLNYFTNSRISQYLKEGYKDGINGIYQVSELQKFLKELGYSVGTIDGDFGSKTDSAVKSYQNDNGLVPDGDVGPNTRAKINNTCN